MTPNQKPKASLNWIDEYHEGVRYGLKSQIIFEEQSKYQLITVIESKRYGKGLLLDKCWMTAEKQDKYYHESLVHPALTSAKNIDKILIIGGGDGGTARECLRYKEVKHIDMVEIDGRVIELSKKYLPNIGGQAWLDNRLNLEITDGLNWVANSINESYDIILIDSSDPKGPAKGLFNRAFVEDCKRLIRPGGIYATQSESPESFSKIHIDTVKMIREVFKFADPLYGCVPIYPSGWWSWTFAAIDSPRYKEPLKNRAQEIAKTCEVWSLRWQEGAFNAIPAFIEKELNQ